MTTRQINGIELKKRSPGHYHVVDSIFDFIRVQRLWYLIERRNPGRIVKLAVGSGQREWMTLRDACAALRQSKANAQAVQQQRGMR